MTKVTSPHYVTPTLRRARLIDWLNANRECRAVVVAADAGYGKTTLLWQWEREVDFPCYWYKLDRNDRDWSLHISYLIEAISQRHPGFGRRAHSMLQQLGGPGSSRPGVAAYLLAEMHERITEPCTFIIDDWQFVASVTEVRGLWNQILRDAPPTCRFIFLSRAKPHLQFARFKTHGGYAEMRTDALRFTDREIEELFRDIYNDPLDPTELAELERRTEGWAASLQLVEVSLRERKTPDERRAFIQSITATTDSDLFAFLAEEVLDQQDERTRDFLLATSILHHVPGDLAGRLTGVSDGKAMLQSLEQRGLFTNQMQVADGTFRYHGLFREFLERRLAMERAPGEVVGLHIHAASYFETTEDWPSAIHHYLRAGLQPQAARLIARYGEEVASEGRLGLVDEWLTELPPKTIRDNARLSLLDGEARGIRGEWTEAIEALSRARIFFARKGDKRLESLACLKLSTVHSNRGDVSAAAEIAAEGLQLAPADALAIRLRLCGNLSITAGWVGDSLDEVVHECRRIAVEAKAGGWEHYAAIALHNLGATQRHMGQIDESVRNLELAARFWSGLPASPFADNSELVIALLAAGKARRAELIADTARIRTEPWVRPNSEASLGKAHVLAHNGEFHAAIHLLRGVLENRGALGPIEELLTAQLVECLYLVGRGWETPPLIKELGTSDPRLETAMIPARAVVRHAQVCRGGCLSEVAALRTWDARGARYSVTTAMVKLGALALDHAGARYMRFALEALRRARSHQAFRPLRWWLRLYAKHAARILEADDGEDLILALLAADPDAWRNPVLRIIPTVPPATRSALLEAVSRVASEETLAALREIPGTDVSEARRRLVQTRAPRLFVRSFGAMTVHTGSWGGPTVTIERRRSRALLGLLIAHFGSTLSRDMVLDIMWPDADPGSAVNSLNQTVFQLRRAIDPSYRDGESPMYIISNVDLVQFNPELVSTDLEEFRQQVPRLASSNPGVVRAATTQVIDLLRGEFLSELRYEDWAARMQAAIHAEIRDALMPIALGRASVGPDLAIRAASALVQLDEYDDAAYIAMARQLSASGRQVAARELITRYLRRVQEEFADSPSSDLIALASALRIEPWFTTN